MSKNYIQVTTEVDGVATTIRRDVNDQQAAQMIAYLKNGASGGQPYTALPSLDPPHPLADATDDELMCMSAVFHAMNRGAIYKAESLVNRNRNIKQTQKALEFLLSIGIVGMTEDGRFVVKHRKCPNDKPETELMMQSMSPNPSVTDIYLKWSREAAPQKWMGRNAIESRVGKIRASK